MSSSPSCSPIFSQAFIHHPATSQHFKHQRGSTQVGTDNKHSEHRQRKENHIKHLEQEVIELREKIAQAETQSVLFKHENIAIKTTLQNSRIPLPAPLPATSSPSNRTEVQVPDDQFQFDFGSQTQSLTHSPAQSQQPNSDIDSNMLSSTDEFFNLPSPTSLAWLTNTTLVRKDEINSQHLHLLFWRHFHISSCVVYASIP